MQRINQQKIASSTRSFFSLLKKLFAIGEDNKILEPLAYLGSNYPLKVTYNEGLSNLDGQDLVLIFQLLKPTTLVGKNLHVKNVVVLVYDADAGDYINQVRVLGAVYNSTTQVNIDGTNITAAERKEYVFNAVDMSSYDIVTVELNMVSTDAADWDIKGVFLEYYYE